MGGRREGKEGPGEEGGRDGQGLKCSENIYFSLHIFSLIQIPNQTTAALGFVLPEVQAFNISCVLYEYIPRLTPAENSPSFQSKLL